MSINESVIVNLEKNDKSIYINGVEILLRLLENIIKDPDNVKYRKIKLENKIIKEKLLVLNGIRESLKEIGFQEINGEFHLSSMVLIATIKKYKEFISYRLDLIKTNKEIKRDEPPIPSTSKNIKSIRKSINSPFHPFLQLISFPKVLNSNNSELSYIERLSDTFMQYENKELQTYAKDLIPLEKLKNNSLEKIRRIQKMIFKGKEAMDEPLYDEIFLIELLNWFNTEFFTWMNDIPCKICKVTRKCKSIDVENGLTVEKIICCGQETKFYRYNDVSVLLKTRKGRCGEYANCFTFLCRALNYDARFVYANFDHVWTEVYSHAQQRWIHYDPSENIYDAPLVYQHGWKRDIKYVIGFSVDDIQDITWRYTSDFNKTLLIRTTYSEKELLESIFLLRKKRQLGISDARKKFLKIRNLGELARMLTPRQPTADEKAGRSSGSIDWRLLRGESSIKNGFVFKSNDFSKSLRKFAMRFSCSKNCYELYIPQTKEIIKSYNGWESCVFSSENIFLKKENDWKMVYLARTEESAEANITWKFDFSEQNLKVKSFRLKFETKTYENGLIDIKYLDEEGKQIQSMENLFKFSIFVRMSGGVGNVAFQHTQLFRQEMNSTDYPFDISIEFY